MSSQAAQSSRTSSSSSASSTTAAANNASSSSASPTSSSKSLLDLSTTKELIYRIRDMNKKFRIACSQLIMINNYIDETEVRYHRAQANDRRSYRYVLRLKLCTLEGARNMFYEYAYSKADELEKMQLELYEKSGIAWSDELADESEDDDNAEVEEREEDVEDDDDSNRDDEYSNRDDDDDDTDEYMHDDFDMSQD